MDHPVYPVRFACIILWSLAKDHISWNDNRIYDKFPTILSPVRRRETFDSLSREGSRRWFRDDRSLWNSFLSGWQSQGPIKRYNQFSLGGHENASSPRGFCKICSCVVKCIPVAFVYQFSPFPPCYP